MFDFTPCAAGRVAPVQEKLTAPALIVSVLPNVTVNLLFENDAVLILEEGAVKVQTGIAGQLKPDNVTDILPPAVIRDAVVQLTVTVTPVEKAMLFDKETTAFEIEPKIEPIEAEEVTSISSPLDD